VTRRARLLALAACVLAFSGDGGAAEDVAAVVRRLVASPGPGERQADARRLYESIGFRPLWARAGKPTPQATAVIATLAQADSRGLDAAHYGPDRLRAAASGLATAKRPSAEDVGRWDTALTLALMRYASDAYLGRVPPARVGFALDVEAKRLDLPALAAALAGGDDPARRLAALDPPVPTFARLRDALARTRALAARSDLTEPPDDLPTLHPGDRHPAVPALRRRLGALGDLPETAPPPADATIYDRDLAEAVMRFQERHGRDVDGILGRVTLRDLRVPLGARVRQIALAMERLRWSPAEVAGRFVVVNIPEFRLRGFDDGDPAPKVSMGVIVGSAARRTETPILQARMRSVVFRPYWDVPDSIARKEILPRAARDPRYLERERMEVVSGRLRQRPGPDNALGLVKFVFPNPFDVYLHDTPQKAYFVRSRRDFSHGCMRVADPVGLAEFVLGWSAERITAAMTEGPDARRVDLPEPVSVYVLYTTVVVEDGRISFFDDIYGWDAVLEKALESRYGPESGDGT
jgi:murein L,D-transpeptidase YcbB/YkuD